METWEPGDVGEVFVMTLGVRTVKTQREVGRALPVSHPGPQGTVIKSADLVSSPGPLHSLRQGSFFCIEVDGGMQLFTLVPSHGAFLQSFSWIWELAKISLTSLQGAQTAENPSDPVGFRQRATPSILWVEGVGVGHPTYNAEHSPHDREIRSQMLTSAERRNPVSPCWPLANVLVLAQVVISHMAAEAVQITPAEYVHSLCELISCVCSVKSPPQLSLNF